jgi:hypothetical protein
VILTCGIFAREANAQLTIDVPDNATPGTTISVPVTLGATTNFRGLSFDFTFNTTVFEVTGASSSLVRSYTGSVLGAANTGTGAAGSGTLPGFYEDYNGANLATGSATFNLAVLGNQLSSVSGLIGTIELRVKTSATNGQTGAVTVTNAKYYDTQFFELNLTGESETLTVQSAQAFVWPGDADNNGVVNSLDYNLVLTAINPSVQGNARATVDQGNTYTAKPAPAAWAGSTLGTNNRYIDCNGDGFITISDLIAVLNNFGQTHQ